MDSSETMTTTDMTHRQNQSPFHYQPRSQPPPPSQPHLPSNQQAHSSHSLPMLDGISHPYSSPRPSFQQQRHHSHPTSHAPTQQDTMETSHPGQFIYTNADSAHTHHVFEETPYNDPRNDSFANLTTPQRHGGPENAFQQQTPNEAASAPAQPSLDPQVRNMPSKCRHPLHY